LGGYRIVTPEGETYGSYLRTCSLSIRVCEKSKISSRPLIYTLTQIINNI
jgi:hypothetical protein